VDNYIENINWDNCYIREYKTKDKIYWSIIYTKPWNLPQEIAINIMYVKGGQRIFTDYYNSPQQVAEVLKDPIKLLDTGLTHILIKTRIIQREGIWNKIGGTRIPLKEFKNTYPECFI